MLTYLHGYRHKLGTGMRYTVRCPVNDQAIWVPTARHKSNVYTMQRNMRCCLAATCGWARLASSQKRDRT